VNIVEWTRPVFPALFRRLPSLFRRPGLQPIVSPDNRAQFKDLEDDLGFLDGALEAAFKQYDLEALRQQSRYRRQQLLLLAGGVAGAVVGALQAVFTRQVWLGAAVAALALVSVWYARAIQRNQSLRHYVDARTRAEGLRSLYFQYVTRVGRYAGETRKERLRADVAAVLARKLT
jgi:hypothetical protein